MRPQDYSPLPVMLLASSGENTAVGWQIMDAVRQALHGIRTYDDSPDSLHGDQPILLLVYAEMPDVAEKVGRIYRQWIAEGSGTVFRTADGAVHSRFLLFSNQPEAPAGPAAGFYLDGSDNLVRNIGEKDSLARASFVDLIDNLLITRKKDPKSKPDVKGVEEYIRQRFKTDFPPLAYHNPIHIEDVYVSALRIGANEGVSEHELNLLRVGALFHDAGFIHTMEKHEECGADMAAGVLPSFDFSREEIGIITNMILATRVPQNPISQLDRIICDADLDYLGRDDFYPIGNRLFQELRDTGKLQDEKTWNQIQKKFLSMHSYHTDFCRVNREPGKQARLREIEEIVSRY